jgi:hypothetical protein
VTAVESTPGVGVDLPATGLSVDVPAGTAEEPAGAGEAPPALKEDETRLLQFEVSNAPSRASLVSRGCCSPLPFFRCQGVAARSRPCACQGAQVEDSTTGALR